jgi:penicillin-binding protein 1B
MKKIKIILLSIGALSCLVILAAGIWIFKLNSEIKTGLANKHFLPPTEYYSAPETYFVGMSLGSQGAEGLASLLQTRGYRARQEGQKLFPGDFFRLTRDECLGLSSIQIPSEAAECMIFSPKASSDPEISTLKGQLVAFDETGKILFIAAQSGDGGRYSESDSLLLEPELVAQYLDGQPIMQDYTPLGEIPPLCLNAVLAIEDSQFLEHKGVSVTGIGRALLSNISGGKVRQGGSTITQQLVKNYFLTSERTLKRKATEFFMSLILETHSSKDEILETYLNIIYLGQNGPFQIRGFPAAARFYFSKPIQELGLPECSLLAAILNSPGLYDPFHKPQNALHRRNLVLERMTDLQMISSSEAEAAKAAPLPQSKHAQLFETAPYYINAVNAELAAHKIEEPGLKIFTGLSMKAQEAAQEAVRANLDRLETHNKKIKQLKEKGLSLEGVLLSANNKTGLINSIVGGRSYRLTQFNRAIDAHRQVGSIMKPFVYLTALMNNGKDGQQYDPLTTVQDSRFTYKYQGQSWSPENYGHKYYGPVPMYFALKSSLNAATASIGLNVGLDKIIDVAHRMGIESPLQEVPSLTLGAFELYPKEVLSAYVSMARLGSHLPITTIRSVCTSSGQVLFENHSQPEQVEDAKPVSSLVSMMKQTIETGTAASLRPLGFTAPAAGKTGTTSDSKDAWFAGFTPYLTTVVWVGYDQPTANTLTGASGAVPAWASFMKNYGARFPADDFTWPKDADVRHIRTVDPSRGDVELDLVFPR